MDSRAGLLESTHGDDGNEADDVHILPRQQQQLFRDG